MKSHGSERSEVRGIEISLPISAELTLVYLCPSIGAAYEFDNFNLKNVGGLFNEDAFKYLQARDRFVNAERFVIDDRDDFDAARDIISRFPSTRFGPRVISNCWFMPELQEILVSVWRQILVDGAKYVQIGDEKYPVRETSKRRLKQVDFRFEDHELRGLEQNPDTKSRWAKMARDSKKVMQFLEGGRYVAVVVDGRMKTYG